MSRRAPRSAPHVAVDGCWWPAHPPRRMHRSEATFITYIVGGPRHGEVLEQWGTRKLAYRAARKANKHPERLAQEA